MSKKSIVEAKRDKAFRMRLSGMTYRQIGQELGISAMQAFRHVQKVITRIRPADSEIEDYRTIETARLEHYLQKIQARIENVDLNAIDRAIRINERISKLYGLEIQRHENEISVRTPRTFAEWIKAENEKRQELKDEQEAVRI